ncbi:hypothetical protein [Streptomyces sp. H27-D2]|uniref:hypothetical protein n=1 Tax=Streptomyces sp. H27-D2 TaxID=3046304 RepID=UPI002DBADCB9|nr:hypothetical protein [Streptomyces sp. H27-D2]MEC4019664.1 hypothetical protein [Streptomyces sp. H27-D2]
MVVHPLLDGDRRVTVDGELVGRAVLPQDLVEFLRLAGLGPGQASLRNPAAVEWRGDGPDTWGNT